jgi:deazaflavin-dependent oxidoreductase (nitroreductase family)
MPIDKQKLEREFFRMLNRVVEPAVRKGVGSPRFVPSGLIVLETTGYKSGARRRTPLAATRLQGHVFVSTFRADRSNWLKNLQKRPRVRYYLGGKAYEARAFVMVAGKRYRRPKSLPPAIAKITDFLAPYTRAGWAFAVLQPVMYKGKMQGEKQ